MTDAQPSVFDSDESLAARRLWARALPQLASKVTTMTYASFVMPIKPIRFDGRCLELGVTSAFAREWLQKRYETAFRSVLEPLAGTQVEIRYTLLPAGETGSGAPAQEAAPKPSAASPKSSRTRRETYPEVEELYQALSTPPDPDLRFETFVVGKENRLAYASSVNAAEEPALHFNPLFIYGPCGLGKTHLLHSIAQRAAACNDGLRILLTDGESFTHQYVHAVRERKFDAFRRFFRTVDIWLVDDVQTIAGREHTQEEFFHLFNMLYQTRRQIVLASNRSPRELHAMDERLRSRLEAGLIADIAPPSLETRIAILQQFCKRNGYKVPDEILCYIAEVIQSNVRALGGVVTRLVIQASIQQSAITMEMAEVALGHFFVGPRLSTSKAAPPLSAVAETVADAYGLPVEALKGPRRDARTARARQIVMYLARKICHETCRGIGAFLGRDHTTVQRGIQKIEADLEADAQLRQELATLRARLCD